MERRRFLNATLGAGVALAAWAATTGAFAAGPAALPQPSLPLPGTDVQGRRLIIPTDNPDRFNLKVMEFNPIVGLDPAKWELEIGGLCEKPLKLKLADLKQFKPVKQTSRLKCVQCWSARVLWEGFRCGEIFRLTNPKPSATHVRLDCADKYYDYLKMDELLNPRTLFALGLNGEPLTPEHGAPMRLVIPFKYGYKSSKLIMKIAFVDHGGQGVVADTWPYYSQTGDIEPGYDHPFDFPGETRKIKGGEITEY
jgi:methionine sulfoxide reductase catalytic subunit